MRGLSQKLFDVRTGEGVNVSLMFVYIFLVIASLMIVKPVRNSLFLVRFGVESLPYVFMLVALFAGIVALLYSRFSGTIRLYYLILTTILISVCCLFVFWLFIRSGYRGSWLLYVFYIWVAIFAELMSTQFWLMANFIFDAREARRLFGIIGAGAIAGGIFGGYLTNYLAPRLRTENLLFFCIGFLLICVLILWMIWNNAGRSRNPERSRERRKFRYSESTDNPFTIIVRSRHLSLIAGIVGVGVVVANLVDYQFSAVASRLIIDTDSLTAFFGFWLSTINIVSLGIQVLLTGRVIKYFGVSTSLFFLPVGILSGALSILMSPGLGSAILVKAGDGSFKHSINKAGIELLSLPIPTEVKTRVKAFIDIFVNNLSTGIAGLLLILLTFVLGFTIAHLSLIIFFLVAVWIYFIVRVKAEYVNSFRQAIEKRSIDLDEQSLNLEDASLLNSFFKVLDGENDRQILYVLKLLQGVKNNNLIPYLKKLIRHPSDEVKACVLEIALDYENLDLSQDAHELMTCEDQSVRMNAIRYLCERSEDKIDILSSYQEHPDYKVRGSAIVCAARAWNDNRQIRGSLDLMSILANAMKDVELLDDEDEKIYLKISAARFVGISDNPALHSSLGVLLSDRVPEVVQAAVISVGQAKAKEFIPVLIQFLQQKSIRRFARQSLADFGEEVIGELVGCFENPHVDVRIRRRIPRVLALIRSRKSAEFLLENLDHRDLSIRNEVIRALNKLKVQFPALKMNKAFIENRISFETGQYYSNSAILFRHRNSSWFRLNGATHGSDSINAERAKSLLTLALEEKLDDKLERIFRLLGLSYQPDDMYHAYLGVTSNKTILRADSIEFLDNVLKSELARMIIPIVESLPDDQLLTKGKELFGIDIPDEEDTIHLLLNNDDNWLVSCVLYLIAKMKWQRFTNSVEELVKESDSLVMETAKYCLEQIARSS